MHSSRRAILGMIPVLVFVSSTAAICGEIHDAVRSSDTARVRQILSRDSTQALSLDESGFLPLAYAASIDEGLVRLLVAYGADPESPSGKDRIRPIHAAAASGNIGAINALASLGVDLNARDSNEGFAAVQYATIFHHASAVKLLLASGADGDAVGKRGGRAIDGACANGDIEIVRMLLERYGQVNRRVHTGRTLLHVAVRSGSLPLIELLLANGANPLGTDTHGRSALDFARTEGTAEIYAALRRE